MPSQDFSNRERPEDYIPEGEEEAEKDYLAPSRWWFVSTLFPLLAATFGPLASAFSICALVGRWVVTVEPSSNEAEGVYITDPPWLYIINAISLAIAVIANLSVLAHMTGRVRFGIAQPITLATFFSASFLLLGIVIATPKTLQGPEQTLAQGFYYAAMACVIYFILGCLMLWTSYGVRIEHYSEEYKLTPAQRSLMLQTTTFMVYVLASAAVYSRVEGWYFLDAVYWSITTLFTIGYGDFAPSTHLGRGLFFPMAVGGILFVGLIVTSISALVVEAGANKLSVRNVEKARIGVMKNLDVRSGGIRVSWFRRRQNIKSGGSSELEQRQHEFELMRLVQQKAEFDNAVLAVGFALGMFCFVWFIGSVVFWRAEVGVGDWTYFESLYFTYVSFLTIGYGDFSPHSNSSKPAFVMWALLALPTLTVLIGSIGGLISEEVEALTVWLAERLPPLTPALRDIKKHAQQRKTDEGGDFSSAKPPGFMEDGHAVSDVSSEAASSPSQHNPSKPTSEEPPPRPLRLLRQIQTVTSHLSASPPRKYTFEEWTYMLALLGEDEATAKNHRSARDVRDTERDEVKAAKDVEDEHVDLKGKPWSWLGRRSPLMSGVGEPEWVLERLMKELERELGGKEGGKVRG